MISHNHEIVIEDKKHINPFCEKDWEAETNIYQNMGVRLMYYSVITSHMLHKHPYYTYLSLPVRTVVFVPAVCLLPDLSLCVCFSSICLTCCMPANSNPVMLDCFAV